MTVKLTYFRKSGKFYSEGSYVTTLEDIDAIETEVWNMLFRGNRPGLTKGKHKLITLVEVPEHRFSVPYLILPDYF